MLLLSLNILGEMPDSYPIACSCGFLYTTNKNLTSICCSNPNCPVRTANRFPKALEALGIKADIGSSRSLALLQNLHLKHYMEIFTFTEKDFNKFYGTNQNLVFKIIDGVKELNDNGGINLSQYVDAWCFDGLGSTRCSDIFARYDDLQKFFDDNAKDPLDLFEYISKCCKISRSCDTVTTIGNVLLANKQLLIEYSKAFKFKKASDKIYKVAITKNILNVKRHDLYSYPKREYFLYYLTSLFDVNIIYEKHYSNKCNVLICDEKCNTTKIKKAGDNVITSSGFLNLLLNTCNRKDDYIMIRVCDKNPVVIHLPNGEETSSFNNIEVITSDNTLYKKKVLFNFSESLPIQDYVYGYNEVYTDTPAITIQEIEQLLKDLYLPNCKDLEQEKSTVSTNVCF